MYPKRILQASYLGLSIDLPKYSVIEILEDRDDGIHCRVVADGREFWSFNKYIMEISEVLTGGL